MTNSILIGKAIYALLMDDQDVTSIVGTKIAPIVVENDTTFPFLTYSRDSITESTGTKDGIIGDIVVVRIDAVADSYNQSIDLANAVRKCLEKRKHVSCGLLIEDTFMSGINESWDSDTYIQTMRFTCLVNNS